MLLCQLDAYQRSCNSVVTSITEKGSGSSGEALYEVVLSESVIYPEGGGQPADHGTLDGFPVLDCYRKGKAGPALHLVSHKFEVGASVQVEVDWERRFDHMQQHTAQHLVTAIAFNLYNWETVSWALGTTRTCIDVTTPKISASELDQIERVVNNEIANNLSVSYTLYERDALPEEVRSRGVPPGEGPVRVVSIGELDKNTCGGTHVKSTLELRFIKLVATESAKKNTRLWFVAGQRVMDLLTQSFTMEKALSRLYATKPERVVELVTNSVASLKEAEKAKSGLEDELATLVGNNLRAEALSANKTFVGHHRDIGTSSFLNTLLNALSGVSSGGGKKKKKQPLPPLDFIIFISVGEGSGNFICRGPPDVLTTIEPKISVLLKAKGRVVKDFYRGNAQSLTEETLAAVYAVIEEAAAEV